MRSFSMMSTTKIIYVYSQEYDETIKPGGLR